MVLFFYFAHFLSTDKTNVDLLPMGPGLELLVLGPIEKNQVPVYPLQERTQHFYFLHKLLSRDVKAKFMSSFVYKNAPR